MEGRVWMKYLFELTFLVKPLFLFGARRTKM